MAVMPVNSSAIGAVESFVQEQGTILLGFLPRLVGALLVALIGLAIINCTSRLVRHRVEESAKLFVPSKEDDDTDLSDDELLSKMDPTVTQFAVRIIGALLRVLLVGICLQILNISTTSFSALLAMCVLPVALSLQGVLKDLAMGVALIAFGHFSAGDYVKVAGYIGEVVSVNLFHTILKVREDNSKVIIPNGQCVESQNFSVHGHCRLKLAFTIMHDEDYSKAKSILQQALS
eukprot:TRINITY_DN12970_c0_g1_i1.p1 TRINITY_DN12970_c0_g1~~TRINITY_DN12970_c0_g1_i1.p1  ORF type:complete len:244 (-),score=37.24 TRINITY_DN12970_c0_g1_i1:111-809(-)